jgi:hypothetical protein
LELLSGRSGHPEERSVEQSGELTVEVPGRPAVTGGLRDVLPATAAALGVALPGRRPPFELPAAARAVVVLVDGLGELLLARRASYAPFLSGLLAQGRVLVSGFPSTTATSMATFGTGVLPGAHGMVGYQVLDPGTGVTFNELAWQDGPDPRVWQPHPTVFERAVADGVAVAQIGPSLFAGSGLTVAALRGARFVSANSLDARVDAAASAVRSAPRTLVYLYWGDLDKTGHGQGCGSYAWGEELARVDLALRQLAARLPADAMLVVTADHGMVDVDLDAAIDLGAPDGIGAELARDVVVSAGEPRAPMLHCAPGSAHTVADRWRDLLAGQFEVRLRADAVAAGWFGPVEPRVLPRIGDVVVAATGDRVITDSRWQRPELMALRGMHGARTADEARVPLLVVPAARG